MNLVPDVVDKISGLFSKNTSGTPSQAGTHRRAPGISWDKQG